jgi:broad specificity phosphatase PhoE
MKIYILRHEERYGCPKFYTQLTPTGFKNSELLKLVLEREKIDIIYSSPFPRVLQTIKPYCNLKKMNNVCIEYSLYETMIDPCFTKDEYPIMLNKNDPEFYLTDPTYKSFLSINKINCPETDDNILDRVSNFYTHIIHKYKNTNLNILFAAHGGTLAPLVNLNEMYPLGALTKIYENNKQIQEAINY